MATKMKHVSGEDIGEVKLYALSTCVWCKKTRALLDELGVAYDYVYVDLLDGKDLDTAYDELERLESDSFPTTVVGKGKVVKGFKEDLLRKSLKK